MEEFDKFSKDELLKLLAIIIFSDGSISSKKGYLTSIQLGTVAYNKCQHNLFRYLCERIFNKKVKSFNYISNGEKILYSRLYGKEYILELLKLSPSYKTTANHTQSKESFLNSVQPSLKFILDSSNEIKKLALRIYFDFDGSIAPSFKIKNKKDKKNGKIYKYYQIQFECDLHIAETNPFVVNDLIKICKKLDLNTTLKKDKRNWSGIDGIRISGLKSVRRFIKFGGPVTEVKISSKSPRLKGTTKKTVCEGVERLLNKKILLSYYFKNYEKALKKKKELDTLLMNYIS